MDIPTEDDGLKWFGEGFDGFPKKLPDDCVEYIIYVIDAELQTAAATRNRYNQILKTGNELKKTLLKDYIWQRDPFDLRLYPQLSDGLNEDRPDKLNHDLATKPRLQGRTYFGDSIADEWLIVYLLLELSKRFPDAWIRVYDTDGEFLLIEAANVLPKWLNPEIAENRVWISNGHLRMIPLDESVGSRNVSLPEALSFLKEQPTKLIVSPFVEDEAFYRIRDYPSAISSSLHNALLSIPRNLSYILHRDSSYISPAIEAFYLRDPISLNPLTTKDTSTLHFPPEDFVTASVKFTKVGYAQLWSQIFEPPPAWTAVAPRMGNSKAEMGMKLSCGFEMLLTDPQNQDKQKVREIKLLLEDIVSGEETLPSDAEIATWQQTQDDEKWLDIDYHEFENELSGKPQPKGKDGKAGFGDKGAQENLRRMVSRFEEFLNDKEAGPDGVDAETSSDDDSSESKSDSGEDKDGSYNEAEFERAMKEMMGMSPEQVEQNGLLDEARRLATEDAAEQSDEDEDEEMKKVIELMENELKDRGALRLDGESKKSSNGKVAAREKPVFGPERPPNMQLKTVTKTSDSIESADEDVGPGDGELSSDDEEFNDIDLGLAKNMLESFKGQAGMAGPAGNLMKAMGVNMPRDESQDSD